MRNYFKTKFRPFEGIDVLGNYLKSGIRTLRIEYMPADWICNQISNL